MQTARRYYLAEAGVTIDMGRQAMIKHRVLVFDRNPLFCEVLARQLTEPGIWACQGTSDADGLRQRVRAEMPQVLLVDPEHLGLHHAHEIAGFAREVLKLSPETRLVAYSFALNPKKIRAALEAGFRGCLSKSADLQRLETAMSAVLGGGLFIDDNFGPLLTPILGGQSELDEEPLSEREREVIVMVARGQGTKQIAYDLKISSKTVDTYKSRAVQKLGLKDRAELVDYAIAKGWMT